MEGRAFKLPFLFSGRFAMRLPRRHYTQHRPILTSPSGECRSSPGGRSSRSRVLSGFSCGGSQRLGRRSTGDWGAFPDGLVASCKFLLKAYSLNSPLLISTLSLSDMARLQPAAVGISSGRSSARLERLLWEQEVAAQSESFFTVFVLLLTGLLTDGGQQCPFPPRCTSHGAPIFVVLTLP